MKTDERIEQIKDPELRATATIYAERDRQKSEEHWDQDHDDTHIDGSIWKAAKFYVEAALRPPIWQLMNFAKQWPWDPQYFKPWKKDSAGEYTTEIDRERCLVKAGALILAEQERLDRALKKVVSKLAEIRTQKDSQ